MREVAPTREAIAAAIGERTRLVALSHVLWTDGAVLPLPEISADAHAAGARVLVDGAQGGGAIPFRPPELGCDYYTYSGQKWLCGPSGTGALWIGPEALAELHTPWPWYLSRDRRSGPEPQEWTIARRLDAGTVTLTAFAGVAAALEWRARARARGHLRARRRAGRDVARAARRGRHRRARDAGRRRRRSSPSGRRAASRPTSSRTARSRAC